MPTRMFFIPTPELCFHSKKPKHLEERLNTKDKRINDLTSVTTRRSKILHDKVTSLKVRFDVFENRLSTITDKKLSSSLTLKKDIETNIMEAEKMRIKHLKSIIVKAQKENMKAKKVQQKKMKENALKRQKLEKEIVKREIVLKYRRQQALTLQPIHFNTIKSPQQMVATIEYFKMFCDSKSLLNECNIKFRDISNSGFTEMSDFINNPATVVLVDTLFSILKFSTPSATCKMFLASFLIHFHPKNSFIDIKQMEIELQRKSKLVFEVFLILIKAQNHKEFSLSYNAFSYVWNPFIKAFNMWKENDKEEMLGLLINHFAELSKIWDSVKGEPNAEDEWRPKLIQQQNQILVRIKKFSGKSGIHKLKVFMDSHELVKVPMLKVPSAQLIEFQHRQVKTPESPVVVDMVPKDPLDVELLASEHVLDNGSVNFKLAHTIMVDPNFKFESDLDKQTIESIVSSCKVEMESGSFYATVSVLESIKSSLLQIVPQSGPSKAAIEHVFDMDLIKQQSTSGHLKSRLKSLMAFALQEMAQFCAPTRDEEIAAACLVEEEYIQIGRVVELLSILKLDLANFHVAALRNLLKDKLLDFERKEFASTHFDLSITKEWLQLYKMQHTTLSTIFDNAYLGLFFDSIDYPETFIVDANRINTIKDNLSLLIKKGVLYNLCKAQLTIKDREKLKGINTIKDFYCSKHHFLNALHQIGITITDQVVDSIYNAYSNPKVPIYSILKRKSRLVFKEILKDGKISSRLASFGMELMDSEFKSIGKELLYLYKHNRDVYGPIYAKLLKN